MGSLQDQVGWAYADLKISHATLEESVRETVSSKEEILYIFSFHSLIEGSVFWFAIW